MLKINLKNPSDSESSFKKIIPPVLGDVKGIPTFDFNQFPVGYFAENPRGKALRTQLIKNEIKISEDDLGILEKVFFSKENVDLINKQLILNVFKKTGGKFKICPQKEENLLIVMRYFYLEYARHLPYNFKEQIKELNCMVIGEILPTVVTNADSKIGYMRDITTQPVGPPLPINTKNLQRTLPSISNTINLSTVPKAKLIYVEETLGKDSNIQGFPGLQGFDYTNIEKDQI